MIRNLVVLLTFGIAIPLSLTAQGYCETQRAEVDKVKQWVSYDRQYHNATLATNEAKLAAANESLKDCQKREFLSSCKAVAPVFGEGMADVLCDGTVKENADQPEKLASYKTLFEQVAEHLKKVGPEAAKQLVLQCTLNATQADPKPTATLFCLKLHTIAVEKLAEGKGAVPEYAAFLGGDNHQSQAKGLPSVYPTGDTPDERNQRAAVRAAMVAECLKEGDQYLKVVCGGLTIHEMFAHEPYGDKGDVATALDSGLQKLQNVLAIHTAVSDAPKIAAQQLLTRVGVPPELLQAPDQIQQTITLQLQNGAGSVKDGVDHLNGEIQKAAPPQTKGSIQVGGVKICSPFGC